MCDIKRWLGVSPNKDAAPTAAAAGNAMTSLGCWRGGTDVSLGDRGNAAAGTSDAHI